MCYLTFNNDEQREKIKMKKKIKEILNMCEFFLDANKCLELCIKKKMVICVVWYVIKKIKSEMSLFVAIPRVNKKEQQIIYYFAYQACR